MDVSNYRLMGGVLIATAILTSCNIGSGQSRPTRGGACHTMTGRLADTLYLKEEVADATPPRPRPPHLAPYPPAADGDFTVQFRGAKYYATGRPARVDARSQGEDKLIRIGKADSVPIYTLEVDLAQHPFIWAPITEACVFLPFRHQEEMH